MQRDGISWSRWVVVTGAWISTGLFVTALCAGTSAIMSYTMRFNVVEARADRMDYSLYLELTKMTSTEKDFLGGAAVMGILAIVIAICASLGHRRADKIST